jgi:HD-like signal output (HDOD) protein/ActR/RegA family two-component response regulator
MSVSRRAGNTFSGRAFFSMVTLMLVSEHERETQILKMAFEQRGIQVLLSKAQYQNYIKTLQFLPDLLLIELPHPYRQQLQFASLIKSHKKGKRIPIIGYGDPMEASEKNGVMKMGVTTYFERPIKFSQLIKLIETFLKQFNKKLDTPDATVLDKEHDIELLLATDTAPMKKIQIMTSYVTQLLAFPFTVAKVLSLAESIKTGAADLARVIEADPVLSTQILKLSNSVLFASLNRRISSIKDAIVRIGFRETKRLVMSMSVMKLFKEENKSAGFDRMEFWYHSLACGVISERLARRVGTVNSEEVFLAGLLHDFGIIILDEFLPTILLKILEDTSNRGALFIDREMALLGINHNDVLKELFEKWKLPELVREGIVRQYNIDSFKDAIDTPEKRYAVCIAMGNFLAKTVVLGKECDMYVTPIDNAFFTFVKMQSGFSVPFLDDIYQELNLYKEFLKLDLPNAAGTPDGAAPAEKKRIGVVNLSKNVFVPPLLYLGKLGFDVVSLTRSAPPTKYDSAFETIIAWADDNTTAEDIARFSNMVKYSDTPPDPSLKPAIAPLLALVPKENQALASADTCKNVSFSYSSMDLRQLDKNLTSMAMGKTVSLLECEVPATPADHAQENTPVEKVLDATAEKITGPVQVAAKPKKQ